MSVKKIKNMQNCQCDNCSQNEEDCKCAECGMHPNCCDNPANCGCDCPNDNDCPDCTINNCTNKNKLALKNKGSKIYQFTKQDKSGNTKNVGKMEIKNQTNGSADLYFYGDIVSIAYNPDDWWSWGNPEDKAPQDVADFLNELDGMTDVNIHINSGGGDVFAGIAIYNILKNNSANKTTYVEGLAASAASIIALASDNIIIPSSAQFMIHNAWTFAQGNANDFRQMADWLDQIGLSLVNIYMDNAKDGVTEEQIKQMMDDETWMTGEQAAEYFNIQVDQTAQAVACASSEFFGKYKHLPKNLSSKETRQHINAKNNDEKILKVLNEINSRLDKLEKPHIEEPKPQNNEKIERLKAKLALECEL